MKGATWAVGVILAATALALLFASGRNLHIAETVLAEARTTLWVADDECEGQLNAGERQLWQMAARVAVESGETCIVLLDECRAALEASKPPEEKR